MTAPRHDRHRDMPRRHRSGRAGTAAGRGQGLRPWARVAHRREPTTTTVLVVQDDREIREVLRRYLERAGYAVHTTGSGAEAIRVVDSGGAGLVVLDLGLPDIDGLDVLTAAREAGVPVVVLTAR